MGGGQSSPAPPPAPPVIQGADFPGSGARPQGVSISESDGCKGDCDLTFVPGISTSTVSLTRKFGSVSNCSKFGIDLDKVKKKQMSVSDFVGGVQSSQYLRPLTAGYCEEIRFPDDVVQKIVTLDDLNNNVDKLISVRIRENSASGFSADTKAFIKPSIPLKMKFNGNDISVNTITMYHPSPLRVQDQQADAVISLNDPSAGDDSSYIILIPITTGNPETPSAKFFGKIANQLSSVELPILATGQYAKTDIQTGKDWGLSDLFPIGAVEGGQAKVDAGFFVWEGMPAFERYLDFWRSNANVTQYAWRRKDNGGKPIKYIMLEKPLPVSPNDLAALIRSLPVTDWTDAIHEVFSPENGVLYKQGPPGANCGTPMREHMDNEWTNKLYGETSALGSAISDEVGCDPFSAVNVPDKGFSTKKILTLVFNVLVLVAAAIGAYLALAAVARMYDVEYTDFTKGIGKVVAVYAKKMGAKIGKLRDIATMARGGPAGLAGLAAPGGLAALGAPGAPAAPGGLAALTAPGGLAALTAPGGLAALTAPGGLAALGGPGAPAALADEVPEAPEAPAALADIGAQANSRGISPGIASRMKNFSSSAAVTPTGQASRGLFNMARTMGRARPDRDHGGLTRRARR